MHSSPKGICFSYLTFIKHRRSSHPINAPLKISLLSVAFVTFSSHIQYNMLTTCNKILLQWELVYKYVCSKQVMQHNHLSLIPTHTNKHKESNTHQPLIIFKLGEIGLASYSGTYLHWVNGFVSLCGFCFLLIGTHTSCSGLIALIKSSSCCKHLSNSLHTINTHPMNLSILFDLAWV